MRHGRLKSTRKFIAAAREGLKRIGPLSFHLKFVRRLYNHCSWSREKFRSIGNLPTSANVIYLLSRNTACPPREIARHGIVSVRPSLAPSTRRLPCWSISATVERRPHSPPLPSHHCSVTAAVRMSPPLSVLRSCRPSDTGTPHLSASRCTEINCEFVRQSLY